MSIRPPARLVDKPKKTKKNKKRKKEGRKEDTKTVANWLFAQTTYVVGSKSNFARWGPAVCSYVKCDPNRLRGYGAVGVENGPSPFTLASGLYNSLYYRAASERQQEKRKTKTTSFFFFFLAAARSKKNKLMHIHGPFYIRH